ncbi:MAG TPA: hypothetical protein VFB74_18130 [Kribbellaceae bacterium]|nr:hypothetical protein [Kribbellaceae bacterium]
MRVLFTLASPDPRRRVLVPLGWALQAAGHELRVLELPGEAGELQHGGRAGASAAAPRAEPFHARGVGRGRRVAAAWRPDLVVADELSACAALAARVAGASLVLHLDGPDGTTEPAGGRLEDVWPYEGRGRR